jgi:hypothetical protein
MKTISNKISNWKIEQLDTLILANDNWYIETDYVDGELQVYLCNTILEVCPLWD